MVLVKLDTIYNNKQNIEPLSEYTYKILKPGTYCLCIYCNNNDHNKIIINNNEIIHYTSESSVMINLQKDETIMVFCNISPIKHLASNKPTINIANIIIPSWHLYKIG